MFKWWNLYRCSKDSMLYRMSSWNLSRNFIINNYFNRMFTMHDSELHWLLICDNVYSMYISILCFCRFMHSLYKLRSTMCYLWPDSVSHMLTRLLLQSLKIILSVAFFCCLWRQWLGVRNRSMWWRQPQRQRWMQCWLQSRNWLRLPDCWPTTVRCIFLQVQQELLLGVL